MMSELTGKAVIITGASSGIGRSYARRLATEGANLVLLGRDQQRLTELAESLPTQTRTLTGDVSDPELATQARELCLAEFGGIDIVLPNAGLYLGEKGWEVPAERVHQMVTTNIAGVMHLIHAVLPYFLARGTGDIFVTSSVSGHQVIHWEPVYSATKHAVNAFVHATRQEIIGSGVRLGAIAPGIVLNELWGVDQGASIDDQVARHQGMRSEDVAEALVFMIKQPRHVTVRDLVMVPTAQPI